MAKHCNNLDCPALERDGVPAEYADRVSECPECGIRLASGERPEPTPSAFRELVCVYVASNQTSAHIVRSALEEQGIPVTLSGESLAGAIGELPATVLQIRVEVEPAHAEAAREIAVSLESDST